LVERRSIDCKRSYSAHKVKGGEQPVYSKNMITMKVTNEYMVYFTESDPVSAELHLGSFSAVD
jgi:hypothetical protein